MQVEIKSVMNLIVDDVKFIRKPEVRIIRNGNLKVILVLKLIVFLYYNNYLWYSVNYNIIYVLFIIINYKL